VTQPRPAPSPATATGLRRYKRHWRHILPARWPLIGGLLSGAIFAISTGLGLPLAMKYLLPIFFNQQDKIDPKVLEFSRRFFGDAYIDRLMVLACVGLPLVFVIRGLAAIANRYLINKAGFIVLENIRLEVYNRLLSLPLAFYQRNKAGDLQARLMGDTDKLKGVVVNVGGEIIKQPFTLIAAITALIYLCATERSALFALIAMLSVPLCVIPIRIASRQLVKRSRQLAGKSGELSSITVETLQSPLEVQAYNLQNRQRTRFTAGIREIFGLTMKTVKYQSVVNPVIEIVSVCGFVAALFFGTRNGMTYETFSALALALYMSYEPVKKLSAVHNIIKTGEASLERLEYILDAEDTVPAPASPRQLTSGPLDLAFENVAFAYAPRPGHETSGTRAPAALLDISLHARPGETIALVGPSGAGKSTFITLIPRFYDPSIGRVTLGGIDLRDLDKTALRDLVAVVPQQPLLFNASFAENIRMGRLSATDAEVETAARRAHAHEFIAAQPQGYSTMVGERGNTLSGGQRQRIAIARAFLKNAPILILDEATSALDSESEAAVQEALRDLVKGRTTFMIAHRFSSIRHATRILVFEHGRVIADGSHDALYTSSSAYRDLCDHQVLRATKR
jgi:subfamily B ATP-binding cassette protein MsbA